MLMVNPAPARKRACVRRRVPLRARVRARWPHVQLSAQTAMATLQLADFLQMAALRGRCASFIASTLRVDTMSLASTLEEALGVGEQALVTRCMEMIEANTSQVRRTCRCIPCMHDVGGVSQSH